MPDINKAYQWAVQTCNAPNVGYSQTYRQKKKIKGITYYDCSSFIWYALKAGGFDVVAAHGGDTTPMNTRNEHEVLINLGFEEYSPSLPWLPGDIAWKPGHTEMVYEPKSIGGICMGAHTGNAKLANQVSIGSSKGDPNYTKSPSDWQRMYRYGSGAGGLSVSPYVVAVLCGNFWQESTLNPGLWEGLTPAAWDSLRHGFGLGQWTNTDEEGHGRLWLLHEWLSSNGYANDDGDGQLTYLTVENRWLPSDQYGMQFDSLTDFLYTSQTDIGILTHAFNNAWEGIHDATWDSRVGYANRCYDYIMEHAQDEDIKGWIVGNNYLGDTDRLNNAVIVYRFLTAGGGGGGTPGKPVSKSKMPLWGRSPSLYQRRW